MKRMLIGIGVSVITLFAGILVSVLSPKVNAREPLQVTVSSLQPANSQIPFDHYTVLIKNVSSKTVRGYSLGSTCECQSWDSYGTRHPRGIQFSIPNPDRQHLLPGETQEYPLFGPRSGSKPTVWVDLVHFENDGNWGTNSSRTDGYVRGS
ncbi:MAG TPA: hypothetical protein VFM05_10755 [Candidatus Saccharimonadales bacterium]|nr:hypothetical protein [Candidatus Saccharimonadales bacterium]